MAIFFPPPDAHEQISVQASALRSSPVIRALCIWRVVQPSGGGFRHGHLGLRHCPISVLHEHSPGHPPFYFRHIEDRR